MIEGIGLMCFAIRVETGTIADAVNSPVVFMDFGAPSGMSDGEAAAAEDLRMVFEAWSIE